MIATGATIEMRQAPGEELAREAGTEGVRDSSQAEGPEERVFSLPCGYVTSDGTLHREVELAPLTGKEEEYLAVVRSEVCAARVVTGLLSRCVKRLGTLDRFNSGIVRDLPVSDRDYLILKLREISFGKQVEAILRCPQSACGKPMEVAFSLDAFEVSRLPVPSRFIRMPLGADATQDWVGGAEDGVIEFRLPTGTDQESLAELARQNNPRAVNLLLARCVRRIGSLTEVDEALIERLPAPVRVEIENRMQEMAPRMTIDLEGVCPECRNSYAIPFDGISFFIAEMGGNARRLQRDVHLLAWHYHWSELEILSLPTTKRQNYVRYLEKQLETQDHA